MGEVIEHLLIAPWIVLGFIKTLINPGGFLVLTTPNAVTITKRLFLLMGRNPFEMLREDLKNPGHFREYTIKELIDSGKKAGLSIEKVFLRNYFIIDNPIGNALFNCFGCIPSLRNGITIVYRSP
jgi:2-polyprenyl-3-methyl-5-hydroxy-6-metoxy-1,4-benzoquinol methylase